jgi:hypothetical protein
MYAAQAALVDDQPIELPYGRFERINATNAKPPP